MDCWACELARGEPQQWIPDCAPKGWTPHWFYLVPNIGIVVKDATSAGYSMRLLYVPELHIACGGESKTDRREAVAILTSVVKNRLPGYRIVRFDLDDHSYKVHWHAQACLERRGDG